MAALGPKCDEGFSYLVRLSSGSGGRTTKRPSIGNAFCSILIPQRKTVFATIWGRRRLRRGESSYNVP